MNTLQISPETGFVESRNSLATFDSVRKIKMLQLAQEYIDKFKVMPKLIDLCNAVNISIVTAERHLKYDEKFKEAFRSISLQGEDILSNVMFERGKTPGGFMDRIAWLKRWFPERWGSNQENTQKIEINLNTDKINASLERMNVIDTEIVKPVET